ncbi:hypothetical protein AAMO2058_000327700 [Amorphochlora amoebiformis]
MTGRVWAISALFVAVSAETQVSSKPGWGCAVGHSGTLKGLEASRHISKVAGSSRQVLITRAEQRRRSLASSLVALTGGLLWLRSGEKSAYAGPQWGGSKPLLRPLNIPRDRIDMDTAITMMRSSYDVTDMLDVCPMDDFQTQFYKKRIQYQSEYTSAFYSPDSRSGTVNIGDLGDPQYFDYISFVQYAVINDQIDRNRQVFEEAQGVFGDEAQFETKIVIRDTKYSDKAALIKEHNRRVGDLLLDHLLNTTDMKISFKARPAFDTVLSDVRKLQNLLVAKRFCGAYELTESSRPARVDPLKPPKNQPSDNQGERGITVTWERPCNLWSQQALLAQGYTLRNDFEAKIIEAYLRRCEIDARIESYYRSLFVTHTFYLDGYPAPMTSSAPGGSVVAF